MNNKIKIKNPKNVKKQKDMYKNILNVIEETNS